MEQLKRKQELLNNSSFMFFMLTNVPQRANEKVILHRDSLRSIELKILLKS